MTAFSGVRSSCDMLARSSDLCRLATARPVDTAGQPLVHRFKFVASAPSSSRLGTSTCFVKSPAAISLNRTSILRTGPISDHEIA